MKNKTYLKTIFREIKSSFGRFLSIVLIVFLGTFIFVGVKTTKPVMAKSGNDYVQKGNLSDLQIISTGGITQEDEAIANSIEGVSVESAYQFYSLETKNNEAVQYFSYNKDASQNKLVLVEGNLPEKNDEIVLDQLAQKSGYSLGDTYTIDEPDLVSNSTYTIVGFANSPLFLSSTERGSANIGDGSVTFFAYLPEENFIAEAKTVLYLSFANTQALNTYSDEYLETMSINEENVKTAFSARPAERLTELKSSAQKELDDAKKEVNDGVAQIQDAKTQVENAQNLLDEQKAALSLIPEVQRAVAEEQINSAQKELDENSKEISTNEQELKEAQEEIEVNQEKIDTLSVKNIYSTRIDNVGFQDYQSLGNSIGAIANIFPLFFFLIAALISFTTTTRMVEENRREIGTLKALGYKKGEIALKYIVYNVFALLLGVLLGSVLGTNLIPRLVFYLSSDRFNISPMHLVYDVQTIIVAVIAFSLATLGSALFILYKNLNEKPADLLQPKAPKAGKKILLEYITPLWSRLSFNQKISYRNLFRYKSRMFMAILGIAGCTGLMVAGGGLNDSISSVTNAQYGEISHYQAIITLNSDATNKNSAKEVESYLSDDSFVTNSLEFSNQSVKISQPGESSDSISLFTFGENVDYENYITIKNEKDENIDLSDYGATITDNFAHFHNIEVGDTVIFVDSDLNELQIKITNIAQNCLGNFIYMNQAYYNTISQTPFAANSFLIKTTEMDSSQEKTLTEDLIDSGNVSNVSYVSTLVQTQTDAMGDMGIVVVLFIVLSGLLAFVVLYNLTNINIHERERELSTIKVLGFYDGEVTMYIVRENIILTLLGILFGYGIGYFLTKLILQFAILINMTLPLKISMSSYVLATVLTIVFTAIVMIVTHFKLKNINMIEALKSNE